MGKLFCTTVKAKNGNPLVLAEGPRRFFAIMRKPDLKQPGSLLVFFLFLSFFFFFSFSPPDRRTLRLIRLSFYQTPRESDEKRDRGPSLRAVEIFHVGSHHRRSLPFVFPYILPRENRGRFNSIGRMQMRQTSDTLRSSCYLCPLRARCMFTSHATTFAWNSTRGVVGVDSWHRARSRGIPRWIVSRVGKERHEEISLRITREKLNALLKLKYLASGNARNTRNTRNLNRARCTDGGKFKSLPGCTMELRE